VSIPPGNRELAGFVELMMNRPQKAAEISIHITSLW
jgi:hypothetical protein